MAIKIKPKSDGPSKVSLYEEKSSETVTKKTSAGEQLVSDASFIHSVKAFKEVPCTVGFSAGRTFNLGNYNSAKVQVSLTVPCMADELETVYEYVKGWVDNRMTAIVDESGLLPQDTTGDFDV